jgi:hypothetical protein
MNVKFIIQLFQIITKMEMREEMGMRRLSGAEEEVETNV